MFMWDLMQYEQYTSSESMASVKPSMSPTPEPSPLALGPSRRPRPKTTAEAEQPGNQPRKPRNKTNFPTPAARHEARGRPASLTLPPLRQPRADHQALPPPVYTEAKFCTSNLNLAPPILNKLDGLAAFLKPRPQDGPDIRVVAVDGLDRNAVHLVVASLHFHITKELLYTARVVGDYVPPKPFDPSAIIENLSGQIHYWKGMCDMMLSTAIPMPPLPTPPEGSLRHPAASSPCIYLIPLSPLMATIKASKYVELAGTDGNLDIWRWLAGHWAGQWAPDITINIHESSDIMLEHDVLRIEGKGSKSLFITKAKDGSIDLTPAQLRRVMFEVKEWLYDGI